MPPKALCKAAVKTAPDYKPKECGAELGKEGRCPNTGTHLLKVKTGMCSAGWHEGDAPTGYSGAKAPTCKNWMTCPCDCHQTYDQLFAMSGQPRIIVDNSGYQAVNDFWMPTVDERAAMRLQSDSTASRRPLEPILSPEPGIIPATIQRTFAPTATGRSARGELELMVKQVTDIWAVDNPVENCTPGYVATEIAKMHGIKEPSVGAIDAVFKRWEKLGFALVGVKPTRFLGYTPQGIEHTLEGMKEKARLAKVRG